ncbi:YjcZ family sporulation protein [Bacillus cereus]
MGFSGSCGGGFALLVVLFILLIIVGASCFCYKNMPTF